MSLLCDKASGNFLKLNVVAFSEYYHTFSQSVSRHNDHWWSQIDHKPLFKDKLNKSLLFLCIVVQVLYKSIVLLSVTNIKKHEFPCIVLLKLLYHLY